jgi:rare lipoprotein A (peptidoglycan hydrolase)
MRKLATVVLLLIFAATANAQELGLASVYSPKFQSKFTANGESFSHSEFTASHRKLPFGTMVKITRTDNGRAVIVRITDRGPFVNGYVTNLSQTAALKLGMLGENSETRVKIEVLNEPKTALSNINSKPKPRIDQPHDSDLVEVTAKSVPPRSVPSEYRTIVPSPTPNIASTSRFSPSLSQKKKVRL